MSMGQQNLQTEENHPQGGPDVVCKINKAQLTLE